MKKKIFTILLLAVLMLSKAQAVGVSDIDTIRSVANLLYNDAVAMTQFAQMLIQARDANFIENICNSTQTVTYTNAQKNGLIAQYTNLKNQMQTDFNQLP